MILYLQPCGTVSCSDQRSTDFAGMIDSSLKNYSRITLAHYSHCRSEASSAIKDTKSEAWDAGRFLPLLISPITPQIKQLFLYI